MIFYRPKYPLHPSIGNQTNLGIGSYLTLGLMTGNEYWPAELIRILSKYRRSDLIRWLTAVSAWITAEDGMNIRKQIQMAENILPDDLQCQAAAIINKEGDKFCLTRHLA